MSYTEIFDTLKKIFGGCHRSIRHYMLYDKNQVKTDSGITNDFEQTEFEKLRREEDYDIDEVRRMIEYRKELVFGQVINFVNYFGEIGGFDAILDILKAGGDQDEKLPLDIVAVMTYPFKNCNFILSPTFSEKFVTSVKECIFNSNKSCFNKSYIGITNMSEKEIKEVDKELVSKVLGDIKDFLNLHYSDIQTSEFIESN
jgi:hypothetical protein